MSKENIPIKLSDGTTINLTRDTLVFLDVDSSLYGHSLSRKIFPYYKYGQSDYRERTTDVIGEETKALIAPIENLYLNDGNKIIDKTIGLTINGDIDNDLKIVKYDGGADRPAWNKSAYFYRIPGYGAEGKKIGALGYQIVFGQYPDKKGFRYNRSVNYGEESSNRPVSFNLMREIPNKIFSDFSKICYIVEYTITMDRTGDVDKISMSYRSSKYHDRDVTVGSFETKKEYPLIMAVRKPAINLNEYLTDSLKPVKWKLVTRSGTNNTNWQINSILGIPVVTWTGKDMNGNELTPDGIINVWGETTPTTVFDVHDKYDILFYNIKKAFPDGKKTTITINKDSLDDFLSSYSLKSLNSNSDYVVSTKIQTVDLSSAKANIPAQSKTDDSTTSSGTAHSLYIPAKLKVPTLYFEQDSIDGTSLKNDGYILSTADASDPFGYGTETALWMERAIIQVVPGLISNYNIDLMADTSVKVLHTISTGSTATGGTYSGANSWFSSSKTDTNVLGIAVDHYIKVPFNSGVNISLLNTYYHEFEAGTRAVMWIEYFGREGDHSKPALAFYTFKENA